ncbi:MAG TPA: sensor histidine kinase KdpD [Candidatus Methylomirabilis sp.]|nr:sensor histidine kinase KdpD [Candidatus Methylomirabilis sp.]
MPEGRPDPDALLDRVKAAEAHERRGRLKVFLGAVAGVGKTYAMLLAARSRQAEGLDVLVGWVDTHGRAETEALLTGLDVLPRCAIEYRGQTLTEFDLDLALTRHPTLILVDELAHTNAPGSRHAKRWQDVVELLDAGIQVYTTLNIQHLESLNDVVAQITGVVVRETLPDSVLEQADEVELIDLPPEDLLQRLKDGKVYVPDQAAEAARNFFRKGNLIALRELALRRTADRVDVQMRHYMRDHAIRKTWPVTERILACVGSGPHSVRVLRAAKRFADALRAEWIVAYVETPAHARLDDVGRARVAETLRLAEQLGAETVVLSGHRVGDEILAHARRRNVSKIVVGKPEQHRWRKYVFGTIADDLIQSGGDTDVYIISGEEPEHLPFVAPARARSVAWRPYAIATLIMLACTGLAWATFSIFNSATLLMLFLLGVTAVAVQFGYGPSVLASILGVASYDVFFIPPFYTFTVDDPQYFITFGIMLVVALILSWSTVRIRWLADAARERERRTAALYALSRELAGTRGVTSILQAATRHIAEVFRSRVVVFLPDAAGVLAAQPSPGGYTLDSTEVGVSRWVFEHNQPAGRGTGTLPGAKALYLPLVASRGSIGVLGASPADDRALETPEQLHHLETFANQIALALERGLLAEEAHAAQVRMETEKLRSSLLSSVSHDLRTPLAAITGASSSLLETGDRLDPETRRELLDTIGDEANRLSRLVHDLLEMSRLESGAVKAHMEWHPLEEILGAALAHIGKTHTNRQIVTRLPENLPMVSVDDVLIEQVLINLLDNAAKYSPVDSPIEVAARPEEGAVLVEVSDRGPGLDSEDLERVFEKFYRGKHPPARGVGLGLAICRGFVEAHGGRIWAANRPDGGASFRFTLPLTGTPPEMRPEDD